MAAAYESVKQFVKQKMYNKGIYVILSVADSRQLFMRIGFNRDGTL